jgi:hypothetical protein
LGNIIQNGQKRQISAGGYRLHGKIPLLAKVNKTGGDHPVIAHTLLQNQVQQIQQKDQTKISLKINLKAKAIQRIRRIQRIESNDSTNLKGNINPKDSANVKGNVTGKTIRKTKSIANPKDKKSKNDKKNQLRLILLSNFATIDDGRKLI